MAIWQGVAPSKLSTWDANAIAVMGAFVLFFIIRMAGATMEQKEEAESSTRLSDEQLSRLRTGVELSDGATRPAVVERLRDSGKYTHLEITITEGRNRQVRRMLEAIDSKVLKLVRVAIGSLSIGNLQIGKWRPLTEAETNDLAPRSRIQ